VSLTRPQCRYGAILARMTDWTPTADALGAISDRAIRCLMLAGATVLQPFAPRLYHERNSRLGIIRSDRNGLPPRHPPS
jgi:hypothetical protein